MDKSVVNSMDGSDVELFPFLPYIFQDIWEIGSSPETIVALAKKHTKDYSRLRVLDLGCGKGAVSVKLALALKCRCLGIDAVRDFIDEAVKKAVEYGVDSLCEFVAADIRKRVADLRGFDVVILGSIGPVFGDHRATLSAVFLCLDPRGLVILDDGYIPDSSHFTHPVIRKREAVLKQIDDAGLELVDEMVMGSADIRESDRDIYEKIERRCFELMERHPDKRRFFENYLGRQQEENDVLETKIVCSTMVIRKRKEPA